MKNDVQKFELRLMDNIISLHNDLAKRTYKHSDYIAFKISDPKPRDIHKASVRDRLLHRALYRVLYPFFDKTFTAHSYSCRLEKGMHKAINSFRSFACKVSKNNTQVVWVLKCDIEKFFASIDQVMLLRILRGYIPDDKIMWLISEIVSSFNVGEQGRGLPLGNLTSQLFINIYMNEFDQFVKHRLRAKYYIRYADDFVILHRDKKALRQLLVQIDRFLRLELKLRLHPNKVSIRTLASGVDFLGWVHFPDHRVLRTVTKRRTVRNLEINFSKEAAISYIGMLGWGNGYKLKNQIIQGYFRKRQE